MVGGPFSDFPLQVILVMEKKVSGGFGDPINFSEIDFFALLSCNFQNFQKNLGIFFLFLHFKLQFS